MKEKLINGILHYEYSPGTWIPLTPQELSFRAINQQNQIYNLQATIEELEANQKTRP